MKNFRKDVDFLDISEKYSNLYTKSETFYKLYKKAKILNFKSIFWKILKKI